MKISTLISGFLLLCLSSGIAEMRIWSDKKGNTIEAEFVNIFANKVVLTTKDGRQLKVPMSGLSEADIKYLSAAIPPKIEITVDVDKDRDTVSSYSSDYGTYNYERKAETTKCMAELKKTNQEECSRSLVAHLYVIGEEIQRGSRKVLNYTKHEFDFKYSDFTSFGSNPITVEYTKSDYVSNNGYKYEGYLVVVEDSLGEVIVIEASQSAYEKHYQKIRQASENSVFDDDFDIVKRR